MSVGIIIAIVGGVIYVTGVFISCYLESRITKPSDGLVGLICGELRTDPKSWRMSEEIITTNFTKKNVTVSFCDAFEERIYLYVDDECVEISPSSSNALIDVIKPIIKARAEAEKAAKKARELCSIIKASQDMLHD